MTITYVLHFFLHVFVMTGETKKECILGHDL